jgi:Uri superfamily endonuclease
MVFNSRHGTYALVLRVCESQVINVGALGNLGFDAGIYIYIGSAFGPGGLHARLAHHLSSPCKNHWHIDYLRQHANLVDIWFTYDPVRREHEWAEEFKELPEASVLFPGFGASDCQCLTHLFQFNAVPLMNNLYDRLLERYPDHGAILRWCPEA